MRRNILLGLVVGAALLFAVMPFIVAYGLNKTTGLMLYYLVPITGILTALVIEKYENKEETDDDVINLSILD